MEEQRPDHSLRIILSAILFAIIAFFFYHVLHIPKLVNPQAYGTSFTVRESIERFLHLKNVFLDDVVKGALKDAKGEYAVVVYNLRTGESYAVNEHATFDSASLYKLWVMAVAYQQIQKGKLNPDELMNEDIETLNAEFNIASDEAELKSGTLSATIKQSLNQMITISHNYSALALTEKVGAENVMQFLKENEFKESSFGSDAALPSTTAHDVALFLEKLYRGELADKKTTDDMLSLLKKQQLNNKLPRKLPEDAVIAHKTGELNYETHDAGIVYLPENDYVIVVLSKSDYPPGAEDRIADISKAVFNYFKSESKNP